MGILHSQSSRTEGSPSDGLESYLGHSFEESYPSAERQSVYSIAPADWSAYKLIKLFFWIFFLISVLEIRPNERNIRVIPLELFGRTYVAMDIDVCLKSASKQNHLEVAGSILTTGKSQGIFTIA